MNRPKGKLSKDEHRLLSAFGAFPIRGPETIIAELRCAFVELEQLGFIKRVTEYELTPAGRAALVQDRE